MEYYVLYREGLEAEILLIQCVPLPTKFGISFNNSNTNEDIATKFEQEYVRCVRNVTTSQHSPEVATICFQTGLNPARHILEIPCFLSAGNILLLLQSMPIHFPTTLCELTHYTNTHGQQPYCVGTLSQMTERSAERRVRQDKQAG
jgi:hypothetical protein